MKQFLMCALACVLLGGCTYGEWHSINREFSANRGESQLIDAKQRAILAINKPVLNKSGQPVTYWTKGGDKATATTPNVCAEPSPDALQATAAALSGAGNVNRADIQAALQGALSSAEAAGSFGLRTQTIQLLRDSYYRLCEAFLNDGLDSIAYDVLQRRFQNHIIALLAVEQLTGAVVGAQARLSSSALADSGTNFGLVAQQLENQRQAAANSEAAEAEASAAVVEAKKRLEELEGEISTRKTQLGALSPVGTTEGDAPQVLAQRNTLQSEIDQRTTEKNQIEATLSNLEAAQSQAEARTKFHQGILEQLTKTFEETADDTSKTFASAFAGGSEATRGTQGHDASVVNAVRAITLNAINQDYESQVCFETLREKNYSGQFKNVQTLKEIGGRTSEFLIYCRDIFRAEVALANAKVRALDTRSQGIIRLIDAMVSGKKVLKAAEARDLILALDLTAPVDNVTRFLNQSYEFGGGAAADGSTVSVRKEDGKPAPKADRTGSQWRADAGTAVVIHGVRPESLGLESPDVAAALQTLTPEEQLKLLSSLDPASPLSEQEIVTRIESITRARREVREACGPYQERDAGGACVLICGKDSDQVFDPEQRACVARPSQNGG